VPVVAITLRSSGGGNSVVLSADPDDVETAGYEGPDVSISIDVGGLRAQTTIPYYAMDLEGLAEYFHHIDREWRGWVGAKSFETLGRWLVLDSEHDGKGHIRLYVSVVSDWPGPSFWSARAALYMDIGSIPDIAHQLDDWVVLFTPRTRIFGNP
jgi:hypothetical protein